MSEERATSARRNDVLALIGVVGAVVAVVVIASANAGLVWSRGVRRAHADLSSMASSSSSVTGAASASSAPSNGGGLVAATTNSVLPIASASNVAALAPTTAPLLAIGKGTRVLVFGDSFTDSGLSQRMKTLVEARGGTLKSVAWTSSTTIAWAGGSKLLDLLASFKPDVVFVSIGANEVFLPVPESRAQFVRSIVKKLDGRPCVWIGTPLWKGDTGILPVMKANCAPCGYFDSNTVTIARAKDHIHPSMKGGSDWADAVFAATVSVAPQSP